MLLYIPFTDYFSAPLDGAVLDDYGVISPPKFNFRIRCPQFDIEVSQCDIELSQCNFDPSQCGIVCPQIVFLTLVRVKVFYPTCLRLILCEFHFLSSDMHEWLPWIKNPLYFCGLLSIRYAWKVQCRKIAHKYVISRREPRWVRHGRRTDKECEIDVAPRGRAVNFNCK